MTPQKTDPANSPQPEPTPPAPARSSTQPWRTEGLPKGQAPKPRPRWLVSALWAVGYLILFAILTWQDRRSGAQAVPYTEFKSQVANQNVSELFARGNSI